jgi:hypothetical protein
MFKPGLGKGLGDLMRDDQVAGKNNSSEQVPRTNPTFGRGMESLIRPEETATPAAPPKRPLLPHWFFFGADLLLLAFTVAITFDAPKPLDVGTILFCALSITIGAALAIIGVLQGRPGD